jgi:hypothetical protein
MLQDLLTGAVEWVFAGGVVYLAIGFVLSVSVKVAEKEAVNKLVGTLFDEPTVEDELLAATSEMAIEPEAVEVEAVEVVEVAIVATVVEKKEYSIRQLKKMASKAGIHRYSYLTKVELLEALAL